MMAFVELILRASILTALEAVWQVAAGALVQANSITTNTSTGTTTNVQVARYAVVTVTLENKEKIEVNKETNLFMLYARADQCKPCTKTMKSLMWHC